MTMLKIFGTSIAFAIAIGLAPSASAQSVSTGIFGGGLARQILDQQDAERHKAERRRVRGYEAQREPPAAAASRRARVVQPAPTTKPAAPAATVAKLDDKLPSNSATTTEIPKASNQATTAADTAESSAPADKTEAATGSSADGKSGCRRYSPAIAGLVDVPCE